MSDIVALDMNRENQFFNQLGLVTDRIQLVKSLTYDVLRLEADRGQNALELGRKLRQIQGALTLEDGSKEAWKSWMETFTYTEDYAKRMIQMAEMFGDTYTEGTLSLQHLREVARFSDSQADRMRLVEIAEQNRLGAKQLRVLVSETKKGNWDLDEMLQENPNLKVEIDRRVKAAKEQAAQEANELTANMEAERDEMEQQVQEMCEQLSKKNERIEQLATKLSDIEVDTKNGNGDPELGNLRNTIVQLEMERDNLEIMLKDLQKQVYRQSEASTKNAIATNSVASVNVSPVIDVQTLLIRISNAVGAMETLASQLSLEDHDLPTETIRDLVTLVEDQAGKIKLMLIEDEAS